jgi:hypothetical protein
MLFQAGSTLEKEPDELLSSVAQESGLVEGQGELTLRQNGGQMSQLWTKMRQTAPKQCRKAVLNEPAGKLPLDPPAATA